MIVVSLLRWFFGFIDFEVTGKFPERFLNSASKNGINMWKFNGQKECFRASARQSDFKYLLSAAKKVECDIHIIKYHGLPHMLNLYKARIGLLIGMAVFFSLSKYLSGFIWNIKIDVPNNINEYEIRQELKDFGFAEGVNPDTLDLHSIEDKMMLKDNRISWISINVIGTNAEVALSPTSSKKKQNSEKTAVSNIKSNADGTVTRMEVQNGSATVRVGDGIRKNQLLVSGVIEYSDGSSSLVDSDAQIYAKTSRSVCISVPKSFSFYQYQNCSVQKTDIDIMGFSFPLSLRSNPQGDYLKYTDRQQLTLLGNNIPIYFSSEKWLRYKNQPVSLNNRQAEELLKNKIRFYELFMLYSTNKGSIIKKNYHISENSDSFILTADYEIEEDVAVKSVIQLKES